MNRSPFLFIIAGAICVPLMMLFLSEVLPHLIAFTWTQIEDISNFLNDASTTRRILILGPLLGAMIGVVLYFLARDIRDN